jgi:hypothetical protein
MARWLATSAVLLLIGAILWPWLRQLGLLYLPGDLMVDFQGARIYLPFTTSMLIGAVISMVWWLLNPP